MTRVLTFPLGATGSATEVQLPPQNTESVQMDALVSKPESTAYNYGPCRNRTYNLLVAALRGFWQNVASLIGGTPKYSCNTDAESSISGPESATKVQPTVEPWFLAPGSIPRRVRRWLAMCHHEDDARRIKTRQLTAHECAELYRLIHESGLGR